MHFTTSFVLAALPFLATAAPAPQASGIANPDGNAVTLLAIHSGDEAVHNQPISAQNEAFYIGAPSIGLCPAGATDKNCDTSPATSIVVANGRATLNVQVPGGQDMYVTSNGTLAYTPAHSHAIPANGNDNAFATDNAPAGQTSNLLFNDYGFQGWLACPSYVQGHENVYQIFANVTGITSADVTGTNLIHCHDIAIALQPAQQGGAAWQYQ